jgi:hypothetical protein
VRNVGWSSHCTSTSLTSKASLIWLSDLPPLGSNGVKGRKMDCAPCRCSPHEFKVLKGRWDRNRTCNLRFWRTRHAVFSSLPAFLASYRSRIFGGTTIYAVCGSLCALLSKLLSDMRAWCLEQTQINSRPQATWRSDHLFLPVVGICNIANFLLCALS